MTLPPGTAPRPCTVNGIAPRPSSLIRAPNSRSAASSWPTGRCAARRSPVNSASALPSAATGGTKRMTVPALPTSTVTRPAPLSGRHPPGRRRRCGWGRCGRAVRLGALPVRLRAGMRLRGSRGLGRAGDQAAQRAQRVCHQAGVPGGQRAGDQRGAVSQRGQDERAVGHRLGPGYSHQRPHRPGGSRRAPAPAEPTSGPPSGPHPVRRPALPPGTCAAPPSRRFVAPRRRLLCPAAASPSGCLDRGYRERAYWAGRAKRPAEVWQSVNLAMNSHNLCFPQIPCDALVKGEDMCGRYASARKRIELLEEFRIERDRVT